MDLVKAARQGSREAFARLFDEHHLPLFRFAYRLTVSEADAEDIVQESFLALLRPDCRYEPERRALRTYLFGVVRNQALKRQRLRGHVDRDASGYAVEHRSPESEAMLSELEDSVAGAVMRLPENQRAALILAHYEEMPLAEIAEVMEIEVGAVKSRLQRARAALKEMLAAYAPRGGGQS